MFHITWNDAADRIENRAFLTAALEPVLQLLMQKNSIVQRYLTALEVASMSHGFPMLPSMFCKVSIIHEPVRWPACYMHKLLKPNPRLIGHTAWFLCT